jgi:prepilin signal peptidase PulO-like enzyme (type II secretory pathway)
LLPIIYVLNKRYLPTIKIKENLIAVTLISAFSILLIFNKIEYSVETFILYAIYNLMILLSFIDYKKMSIPDEMNIILFTIATLYTIIFLGMESFAFGMQLLGVFTALWFISEAIMKKEMFGLGDLLYISILGYLINDILPIVYIFLISSLVAIPITLLSMKILNKKEIPYLPFITIAFILEKTFEISKI